MTADVQALIARLRECVSGGPDDVTPDLLEQAADALTAAEQATRTLWEPIDTAPKDGMRVLVHVPFEEGTTFAVQVGRYNADIGQFVYDDESEGYAKAHPPTEWQALPKPPAALRQSPPVKPVSVTAWHEGPKPPNTWIVSNRFQGHHADGSLGPIRDTAKEAWADVGVTYQPIQPPTETPT